MDDLYAHKTSELAYYVTVPLRAYPFLHTWRISVKTRLLVYRPDSGVDLSSNVSIDLSYRTSKAATRDDVLRILLCLYAPLYVHVLRWKRSHRRWQIAVFIKTEKEDFFIENDDKVHNLRAWKENLGWIFSAKAPHETTNLCRLSTFSDCGLGDVVWFAVVQIAVTS
jgi:hypothetical protein